MDAQIKSASVVVSKPVPVAVTHVPLPSVARSTYPLGGGSPWDQLIPSVE